MTLRQWRDDVFMSAASSVIAFVAILPLFMVAVLFTIQLFWNIMSGPAKMIVRLPARSKR